MKIHIIGCSGSGKTYLAEYLSGKYNIPHFDLDDIQWDNEDNSYGKKRPAKIRDELLHKLLARDDWIIEGVYYAWVEQSFEEADMIYVLDLPKHVYITRIILRSIKRKLGIEHGKKETLKSIVSLLKWTDTFQKKNMKEIRAIMEKYADKVIWLTGRKAVKDIMREQSLKNKEAK